MTTITIALPEGQVARLEALARTLGISTQDLVRLIVADLVSQPAEAFDRAAKHVLEKNAELYRRLA